MSARAGDLDARRRGAGGRSKQALRLWLRLLACEGIAEQQIRTRLRTRFGVTLPQFDVLSQLEHAGGPLSMSQLSRELMVSNGNVTGVVDRLARDGLVRRTASPTDRRVHHIELTDEGLARFAEMAHEHELCVAELLGELSTRDLERLSALLREAKASITRAAERSMP